MTFEIIKIGYAIISAILIFRILIVYIEMFIIYMLNQKNSEYDKRVEKPRLLFHIIAFIIIGFSLLPIYTLTGSIGVDFSSIYLLIISISIFILGLTTVIFSWTKKFKNKYIPILENKIIAKLQLKVRSDIDVENYCKACIEKFSIDSDSIEDFRLLLQGGKCKSVIKWTEKSPRSKQISYKSLFRLLDEIVIGGFLPRKTERKIYLSFVLDNFIIEGVQFEKNLSARYSEWITEMNK